MKLNPIAANQTVLELESGTEILFSYKTPVAAFIPGRGYIKTDCRWSVTTSKHITQYLAGAKAETVPQAELDSMLRGW